MWFADLSERYSADTVEELLKHVGGVPPSLVLAQAAEESGWGNLALRPRVQCNALFGQYTWNDDHDGITLKDNDPADTTRRVRAFPLVTGTVAAYVHNLNLHHAYACFRALRAAGVSGYELTRALDRYSERRGEYRETLRMIIPRQPALRARRRPPRRQDAGGWQPLQFLFFLTAVGSLYLGGMDEMPFRAQPRVAKAAPPPLGRRAQCSGAVRGPRHDCIYMEPPSHAARRAASPRSGR